MFFERQRGGLCRMHSLNNYLQGAVFNEATFQTLLQEYNADYNAQPHPADFDSISAFQEDLVSYALRKHAGLSTLYIAPGKYTDCPWRDTCGIQISALDAATRAGAVFVFSANHIMVYRQENGVWFELDSMGAAPRQCQIHSVFQAGPSNNNGFIVPINRADAAAHIGEIRSYIRSRLAPFNYETVVNELLRLHSQHELLGWIEIPLFIVHKLKSLCCEASAEFNDAAAHFIEDPANLETLLTIFPRLILAC